MNINEVINLLQLLINFTGVIVTLFIYINTKK